MSCPLCELGMAWVLDPDHECEDYPMDMNEVKVHVKAHPDVMMTFDLPMDAWIATWRGYDDNNRGWVEITCCRRKMDETFENLRKIVMTYQESK